MDKQDSEGLNLTLELEDPGKMFELLVKIRSLQAQTDAALNELHFVHFSRFLPTADKKALLVITAFDGELDHYILDFAAAISEVFTAILGYVKDAPRLPVHKHPREFLAFVEKNNERDWQNRDRPWPMHSAYPDKTVIELLGPRRELPPRWAPTPHAAIDLADVQGNLLHGYHARFARHFALRIDDPALAKRLLGSLAEAPPPEEAGAPRPADCGDSPPLRITTAQSWTQRPRYFLNAGFTASGLDALGVGADTMTLFPQAFRQGPAGMTRAGRNGDVGDSAPEAWVLGHPDRREDMLVSLYTDTQGCLDALSGSLRNLFAEHRLVEVSAHDAQTLENGRLHFGYRDGLTQPRIAGNAGPTHGPNQQPEASAGEFLLGSTYLNAYGAPSLGELPSGLAHNGCYAAVRLMKQDVDAFERLLADAGKQLDMDPELVAAKLMGRWRNGDPLSLVPEKPGCWPAPLLDAAHIDNFDYGPNAAHPHNFEDFHGTRCPAGSHVRRMNPRGARMPGKAYSRPLVRRGMPYESDGEKGLLGFFMCSDLERQFEFLLRVWAGNDVGARGVGDTQDPFIGAQTGSGQFLIPGADPQRPLAISLPRLVTTRGSLYLFVPGITGLRHLAGLPDPPKAAAPSANSDKLIFMNTGVVIPPKLDVTDAEFLRDPYPFYARMRDAAPVFRVTRRAAEYESYWVFDHAGVEDVCAKDKLFRKPGKPGEVMKQGLFMMDEPRHAEVRALLEPAFHQAIGDAKRVAEEAAEEALAAIERGGQEFDLVSAYARRVPRDVVMGILGIPPADRERLGTLIESMVVVTNSTLPKAERAKGEKAARDLGMHLLELAGKCSAANAGGLLCLMDALAKKPAPDKNGKLEPLEVIASAGFFLLGGYLSTEYLLTTGMYNLLTTAGALEALRKKMDTLLPGAVEEMMRFDAPFQLADRVAAAPNLEIHGLPIPQGSLVTVVYGSANRDAKVFGKDAGVFDIGRAPTQLKNLALGHGPHRCIGAPLLKIVAPIALRTLLERLPNLALEQGQGPQWQANPYFRTLTRLDLRY